MLKCTISNTALPIHLGGLGIVSPSLEAEDSICVSGDRFNVSHTMICIKVDFIVQGHIELRHLETELLNLVCKDIELELVLPKMTGEILSQGANRSRAR